MVVKLPERVLSSAAAPILGIVVFFEGRRILFLNAQLIDPQSNAIILVFKLIQTPQILNLDGVFLLNLF